jgi:WD40 repeat protein
VSEATHLETATRAQPDSLLGDAGKFRYDAFVSYRRIDGLELAKWLRLRLQAYRLPRGLRRMLPPDARGRDQAPLRVFRDEDYEGADEDFWQKFVLPSLQHARHMVVISTPGALLPRGDGQPNWLLREIDAFIEFRRADPRRRIILVLGPGAPEDRFPGRLDDPALGDGLERPRWNWADLRNFSAGRARSSWLRPGFDDQFAKIVAALHDVPSELIPTLRREGLRRLVVILTLALLAVTAIATTVGVLGFLAYQQRNNALAATVAAGKAADAAEKAADAARREQAAALRSRSAALVALGEVQSRDDQNVAATKLALAAMPKSDDAAYGSYRPMLSLLNRSLSQLFEQKKLAGHRALVSVARWHPDSTRLVTGSSDGTVRLWSREGAELQQARPYSEITVSLDTNVTPPETVNDAAWNADGTKVAIGLAGPVAAVWDVQSNAVRIIHDGIPKTDVNVPADVGDPNDALGAFDRVRWSGDGAYLAATFVSGQFGSSSPGLYVWNAESGAAVPVVRAESKISSFTWAPRDSRFALILEDGKGTIVDPKLNKSIVLEGVKGGRVAWSPDGKSILTAPSTGPIVLSDAGTGKRLRTFNNRHGKAIWELAWEPAQARFAVGFNDGKVDIWNTNDAKADAPAATFDVQGAAVHELAWHPTLDAIATGSKNGQIEIWNPTLGARLAAFSGHQDRITSLEWDRTGTHLVSSSKDATARIWDAGVGRGAYSTSVSAQGAAIVNRNHTAKRLMVRTDDFALGVLKEGSKSIRWLAAPAYSKKLKQDCSWGSKKDCLSFKNYRDVFGADAHARFFEGKGKVFNVADESARDIAIGRYLDVWAAAFSSGDRHLLVGLNHDDSQHFAREDTYAYVIDARTGQPVFAIDVHRMSVTSVGWSPDGTRFATSDIAGKTHVWDLATKSAVAELGKHRDGIYDVSWSGDGKLIATASKDRTVRLWDSARGEPRGVLEHTAPVYNVVWAPAMPDKARLVTVSEGGTARIWDVATAAEVATLDHRDAVGNALVNIAVAEWSLDGRRIATGSSDGVVAIWDAETGVKLAELRGHRDSVSHLQWIAGHTSLASLAADGIARVWDLSAIPAAPVTDIACMWLPDRDFSTILGDEDFSVELCNPAPSIPAWKAPPEKTAKAAEGR